MIEPCPVCGSLHAELQDDYRANHPAFRGLKRAHCNSCAMEFATPMPSESALDAYNASYFSTAHGGQPRDPVAKAFFSGIAGLRLAHLERYLGTQGVAVSSLMEFGPGPGFFARSWLARRPETTYVAMETDTSCHDSLREIGVRLIDSAAFAGGAPPVDLVVMSHVLEHVPNPAKFLRNATRSLRERGALFIEVPCLDYLHKPIDEPHVLFFDKKPMHQLLSTLGFDNVEVSYHGQEIDRLRSASVWRAKWMAARSRLIALGLVAPFAQVRPGMETLDNPLERAAVAPFNAHRESSRPAWWLRAVARKGSSKPL